MARVTSTGKHGDRRGSADHTGTAASPRDAAEGAPHPEASFRALIEALPDAVVVSRQGRILYVNPAALRMHGYDAPESLLGVSVLDLIHPDDRPSADDDMVQIQREERSIPFREMRMLRRDGAVITTEVTGLLIVWEGEPAIVGVANDVTARRQVLAELAQRDRLASMGLIAASVAHEVNNPITYVLLNLERLVKDLPDVERALGSLREHLADELGEERAAALFARSGAARARSALEMLGERARTATEGARQVGRIARDLTTFARVENDERAGVDVNALLDKVLDVAANELRFRATVVREYGDLPPVSANQGRLSQVFLNLLLNAAHAIDEGAPQRHTVRVSTSHEGREVRITIADTGRGIAKEHLPRLFDPFFTTKAAGQGSGLGLSICRDIVRSHGGRIEARSAPGEGAELIVHLPIGSGAEAPPVPSSVQARFTGAASRPRVLVVDDERTLRSTLAALLEDLYEVVLAESGAAAFDILAADRAFEAILCDLMMPDVSGMDVHAWVVREAPELLARMVFMTGGAFTRNAGEFLERVPNPHLEKPFEVDVLVECLDRVIRKQRRARSSS